MAWRAATKPQAQQTAAPTPQAMPMKTLCDPLDPPARFNRARLSCGLAARQELAHAVERLEDVRGRVGVGEPHIALTQDAEIWSANDGDTSILKERGGERL